MERVGFEAEIRTQSGTSKSRQLRRSGFVPAVVYSRDNAPVHVSVDRRQLVKMLHKQGENVIIDLAIKEGVAGEARTVIIKDIQHDTLRDQILHIDFQQIKLTEKIKFHVPVTTRGDSDCPGVKAGGVLEHVMREVEIECLPTNIPKEIVLDTAGLNIGDVLHVRDLKVPADVSIVTDLELVVVLVKVVAEEKAAEEVPAEEAATEPEVIKQKKVEDEEAGESDAKPKGKEKEKAKEKEKTKEK